jgi:hypothetical protein
MRLNFESGGLRCAASLFRPTDMPGVQAQANSDREFTNKLRLGRRFNSDFPLDCNIHATSATRGY